MASNYELDVDSVARIGLMFLDGDALEKSVIDRVGQVDYEFDYFNQVKAALMKIEKINPKLRLTAVVWQLKPENLAYMSPMIAGNSLPAEGHSHAAVNRAARTAFGGGFGEILERGEARSHYYPIRNSDHEINGVLELIAGERAANDI